MILAWHVDYWDSLGWKDPFGDKAHTERQRRLQKARGWKQIWTPMICVDGEAVRGAGIAKAIERARKETTRWRATVKPGQAANATIALRGGADLPKGAELIAVLFQNAATTKCTAGENEGRTLKESFVVRARSKPLDLGAARKDGVRVAFDAPKGVAAKDLGIAFLLEDRVRMRTLASWWAPLGAKDAESEPEKKAGTKEPAD